MEHLSGGITSDSSINYMVAIDTHGYQPQQIDLFQNWLSMWCMRHCKGAWSVNQSHRIHRLQLTFSAASEAVYFKLSADTRFVFVDGQPLEYLH